MSWDTSGAIAGGGARHGFRRRNEELPTKPNHVSREVLSSHDDVPFVTPHKVVAPFSTDDSGGLDMNPDYDHHRRERRAWEDEQLSINSGLFAGLGMGKNPPNGRRGAQQEQFRQAPVTTGRPTQASLQFSSPSHNANSGLSQQPASPIGGYQPAGPPLPQLAQHTPFNPRGNMGATDHDVGRQQQKGDYLSHSPNYSSTLQNNNVSNGYAPEASGARPQLQRRKQQEVVGKITGARDWSHTTDNGLQGLSGGRAPHPPHQAVSKSYDSGAPPRYNSYGGGMANETYPSPSSQLRQYSPPVGARVQTPDPLPHGYSGTHRVQQVIDRDAHFEHKSSQGPEVANNLSSAMLRNLQPLEPTKLLVAPVTIEPSCPQDLVSLVQANYVESQTSNFHVPGYA